MSLLLMFQMTEILLQPSYITSFSFKYKSNGTEKEHTVIIDEIIDDIDRSGSFAE